MSFPKFEHDPDGRLDYSMNWTAFLDGDAISTSVWETSDPAAIAENTSFTINTTLAFVRFQNPVIGATYLVTNRITTAGGRVWDKTIKLKVKEQ